ISSPPPPISAPPPPPPPPPPPAPSVSVAALTGSSAKVKSAWQATATIAIQNETGQLVAGAVVKGIYSSSKIAASCTTASNGTCAIKSGSLANKLAQVQFSVTGVTFTGHPYNPALNVKTAITIAKPL